MFGGLLALAAMTDEQRAEMAGSLLRYVTPPGQDQVEPDDQCVNCWRRAGPSGWCPTCWAGVVGG